MSMPKFPKVDPELTCEHALNMILTSIAMEELALSHIINAEGEKLQYVLGTLETSSGEKPDVDEVLKVNQSINCILENVSQNQMLLKNKMDKVLYALSDICPRPKDPPGPPGPSEPSYKCSAVFKAAERSKLWCAGSALHWSTGYLHGKCICFDPCDETKIGLRSKGRFMVSFSVNVKAKGCKCSAAISLQMIKNHQHTEIYTVHSHVPCDDTTVTISMDGIIVENLEHASSLLCELESPDFLMVEDAMLSIMEI